MSALDSPAVVALITVSGGAISTWVAIILNRKANDSKNSIEAELRRQLTEKDATIRRMEKL